MPTVSKKQEKFMQAVAHNPKFAKAAGVPQSVGKEFTKSGGGMPVKPVSESKTRSQESDEAKRSAISGMKKGGGVKKMAMGGYADGGMPMVMKDGKKVPSFAADGQGKMKKGGMAMKKMSSGGSASSRADGIAVKGKTKGKQVTMGGSTGMKRGGKVC